MRLIKKTWAFWVILPLLVSCQGSNWVDVKDPVWWKDAVFYQIFVRSFYDSNGDGIGDFNGLTSKLDYLNDGDPKTTTDLGVQGIWLMPIQPSPSYHGYDVSDYYAVNPDYGTMDDFRRLVSEAQKRGIRVLMDLVINHTATNNQWFMMSAGGYAKFKNWYIWSKTDPGYLGPWGEEVWHPQGGEYYYGVFGSNMPDLNYTNADVTSEMKNVARFWLDDVGVDGFRVDGAKHLIEDAQIQENTAATHAWFKDFHTYYKSLKPDAITVGEVWSATDQTVPYVKDGELDLVFNFPLANDILSGVTFFDARTISTSLMLQERAYGDASFASFLTNHDMARVMTKVNGDAEKAKAAAAVLLTSPGVPFIYYGEEIGMTGDKPDPLIRTPMQWSGGSQAGFTSGTAWETINLDYTTRNVEAQNADKTSLLSAYRDLIHLRNEHYALRTGTYVQVKSGNNKLFAMLRVAEKESVLVLVNLGKEAIAQPALDWSESGMNGKYRSRVLMGSGKVNALTVGEQGEVSGYTPLAEVPANGVVVIQYTH